MGCRAFAHNRRTRSSVSSPESVVRSMQVIARNSHAACHSFLTVRRVTSVCARRSTALLFTRTATIKSRFSGIPRWGCISRPPYCAMAVSEGEIEFVGDADRRSKLESRMASGLLRSVMESLHKIRETESVSQSYHFAVARLQAGATSLPLFLKFGPVPERLLCAH